MSILNLGLAGVGEVCRSPGGFRHCARPISANPTLVFGCDEAPVAAITSPTQSSNQGDHEAVAFFHRFFAEAPRHGAVYTTTAFAAT